MSEKRTFDVAVIGAGPGGYIAAIRAAQLGLQVALIEKQDLGGTCLNVGCIPSKGLLSSAHVLHQVKRAHEFGIETGPVRCNYATMVGQKDKMVAKIRGSLEGLLKANRITILKGHAQFESPSDLKVTGQDGCFIHAEKIIIATGSLPVDVKAFPCDHELILNSTSGLAMTEVPKRLAIIGGGYIGCEFATLFAELGSHVIIIEATPTILTSQGEKVAKFMTRSMLAKGVEIKTNVAVQSVQKRADGADVVLNNGETINADRVIVAVGRRVFTEGLHLDKAGLAAGERGVITVNERMETEVNGIYAIGDVTGQGLAHVASHQGVVAAMNAAGKQTAMHYNAVPAVIFTSPEIATVGITEEQAVASGRAVKVGLFPFLALGKAHAAHETDGFTEIIADAKTDAILGATVIGQEASNLIAEMALAIQNELTLESVVETIHAHPTLAESWHEAAAIALGLPLNYPPVKKR
ncbi:MAG: dihydrolipoyl dehydrogenase [Chlamydiota bacterium]|jgi:dihydrolipoamide dehydrogenase